MSVLEPLRVLFDEAAGDAAPLPRELAAVYGGLHMPRHPARPHVVGNVVTSLDGVVSLGITGQAGGGEISGFDPHDRMVMGLLRAAADVVVIGAGTLRAASAQHLWTAEYIHPPLASAYRELRRKLGKPEPPLTVVVTAGGGIDLTRRLFRSGKVATLVVTTARAAKHLGDRELPPSVRVVVAAEAAPLTARTVLDAASAARRGDLVLVEAGPRLMGDFLAERLLDEVFLTLAPQVAGRDSALERPGFVAGKRFASDDPVWGTLAGVKRGGDHLFLRYAFATA